MSSRPYAYLFYGVYESEPGEWEFPNEDENGEEIDLGEFLYENRNVMDTVGSRMIRSGDEVRYAIFVKDSLHVAYGYGGSRSVDVDQLRVNDEMLSIVLNALDITAKPCWLLVTAYG